MISIQSQINQIRWTLSRCKDGFAKQVGLRRLRDAQRIGEANREQAERLIAEAHALLQQARTN